MTLQIRRLQPDDDRTGFRSGNLDLDRFFKQYAGQNQFKHHIGSTYVALEGAVIVGFATVAASELVSTAPSAAIRRGRPRYPVPVLRLARLATDERVRGMGVGLALLHAVFDLARQMADGYGCVGVLVDAKADAVEFYQRLGFERLDRVAGDLGDRPQPTPMFIALAQLPTAR